MQVKQGILGDCWFLCACVALQKSKYLLNKVQRSFMFQKFSSLVLESQASTSVSSVIFSYTFFSCANFFCDYHRWSILKKIIICLYFILCIINYLS